MLSRCRRKLPLSGYTQGHVSRSEVLGNAPTPPVVGFITDTVSKNACSGAVCSHSEAAPVDTDISSVEPLLLASHLRLRTQVGYSETGSPGTGCRWGGTA